MSVAVYSWHKSNIFTIAHNSDKSHNLLPLIDFFATLLYFNFIWQIQTLVTMDQ